MKQNLQDIIEASDVIVHDDKFAYLKASSKPVNDVFMITVDEDEITVICKENEIDSIEFKEIVKWFKLIEIRVSMPFVAKGFLAKITSTIAEEGLNLLVVSTFSKDYILVRENIQNQALLALKNIGFNLK